MPGSHDAQRQQPAALGSERLMRGNVPAARSGELLANQGSAFGDADRGTPPETRGIRSSQISTIAVTVPAKAAPTPPTAYTASVGQSTACSATPIALQPATQATTVAGTHHAADETCRRRTGHCATPTDAPMIAPVIAYPGSVDMPGSTASANALPTPKPTMERSTHQPTCDVHRRSTSHCAVPTADPDDEPVDEDGRDE